MSARTTVLPNLLNGVSTQAAALRLLTQGEAQVNGYSTLTNGLLKRPQSLLLKNMGTIANATNAYTHMINRDAVERYYVMITNGDLKVYDLLGNQKTVNFPNGKAYLTNATPQSGFSAVTVADYTFVVNRSVVAAMSSARTPTRWPEALVNVLAGNYMKRYKIILNGNVCANYITGDGAADSNSPDSSQRAAARQETAALATNLIASALCWGTNNPGVTFNGFYVTDGEDAISNAGDGAISTALINNLTSTYWELWKSDSSIYMNAKGSDFTVRVEDGFNGNAMKVVKKKCQRFTDLPLKAPDGFHVEITGESSNNFDNYYVKFEASQNTTVMEGVWKETTAQNVAYQFDNSTLPHVLVRESDGTFTFKRATWGDRTVGDDNSSPVPSFIGQKINDMFYHRGRLGVIAGENVVLSASGDVFNFWRKTVTAVLDTDPIDIGSSFPKVSVFKHAQSYNGDLLLFSEGLQARLTGGDMLTPKSAAMKLIGEYTMDTTVKPISTGTLLYWTALDNNRTIMRELWLDELGNIQQPLESNSHCPDFLPKNIFKLASSIDLNMMVTVSSDYPTRLYVYKYYWNGKDKPQASWSYWDLGKQIISADFIGTDLYVLIQDGTDTRLLKMPCQVNAADTGMSFSILLDQRVTLSGGAYDSTLNRTSYTVPYTVPSNMEAWSGYSASGVVKPGRKFVVDSIVATTIRLVGDTRNETVYAGIPYTFRYRFSPFYIRVDNGNGSNLVATEGRTQVLRVRLTYAKSIYFSVQVGHETRSTASYTINDHVLDNPLLSTTDIYPEDGDYSFPVKAENDKCWIDILNDKAVPHSIVSAEWVGLWYPKSRRM
ncbi:hypothetical protein UFOVP149_27 [uncultured Caudovirales phage]|uniref:Tail tubular protein B n=1 Tax=uncultured Caudovirales phage TaxID=2100421 RepID=A0A6J7WAP7_9CAUD|nr:hypothetical protein UFOVP149_27 [uncultured Caudovirales phage]